MRQMRDRNTVSEATTVRKALDHLASPAHIVKGVYIIELATTENQNSILLARVLVIYVRVGGKAIIGGLCSVA